MYERMLDKQYQSVYGRLTDYTRRYIDNKYPCNDGGWIHYRVTSQEHVDDICTLLSMKF